MVMLDSLLGPTPSIVAPVSPLAVPHLSRAPVLTEESFICRAQRGAVAAQRGAVEVREPESSASMLTNLLNPTLPFMEPSMSDIVFYVPRRAIRADDSWLRRSIISRRNGERPWDPQLPRRCDDDLGVGDSASSDSGKRELFDDKNLINIFLETSVIDFPPCEVCSHSLRNFSCFGGATTAGDEVTEGFQIEPLSPCLPDADVSDDEAVLTVLRD